MLINKYISNRKTNEVFIDTQKIVYYTKNNLGCKTWNTAQYVTGKQKIDRTDIP